MSVYSGSTADLTPFGSGTMTPPFGEESVHLVVHAPVIAAEVMPKTKRIAKLTAGAAIVTAVVGASLAAGGLEDAGLAAVPIAGGFMSLAGTAAFGLLRSRG